VAQVLFEVTLPVKIKKKSGVYVASCNVLNVHSQGYTGKEAEKNIIEAIRLFLEGCFEMGTLEEVMKECGFHSIKNPVRQVKQHVVTVALPFYAKGNCLSECRV
jgi:predicted RNase H-like HicB family nuclease